MSVNSRRILISASVYGQAGTCLAPLLRIAVGLACSFQRPRVTIVLQGDAVRCARSCANLDWTQRYQTSARAHNVEVMVEKESLDARGLKKDDLLSWAKVVNTSEVAEQWLLSDLQLRV